MKKFMILALASSALVAAPAHAADVDAIGQFSLSADVDTYCVFGQENNGFNDGNNATGTDEWSQGYAGADGKVVFDIQDDDNTVQTAAINYRIGSVVCNTPFTVDATSQNSGLKSGTEAVDSDFTDLVGYTVRFDLDGTNGTPVDAASSMNLLTSDHAQAGPGRIRLRVPASNDLLLEGAYEDVLTFTMTPSIGG